MNYDDAKESDLQYEIDSATRTIQREEERRTRAREALDLLKSKSAPKGGEPRHQEVSA
ncbi:MAG: hypothetical protein WAX80_01360 [Minisyncoccia bacterium]